MTKADQILQFAREQAGKPYRFGGGGPDAWDCSGLTKMAVKRLGYNWYHGATTQWNRGHQAGTKGKYGYWADSGTIDTMPAKKLLFLFNRDKSKQGVMAHTGIYDGNGRVIQAGGRGGKGVHDNPLIKSAWSHWAVLEGVEEDMANVLTIGSSGDEVKIVQQALIDLQHDLGRWGADGKFGAQTAKAVREFQEATELSVTGVWGEAEWDKLHEIVSQPGADFPGKPPEEDMVKISRGLIQTIVNEFQKYLDA